MRRGLDDNLSTTAWMLQPLTPAAPTGAEFHSLLDDTAPDDLLARLEQTVWLVQSWSLSAILERNTGKDAGAAINMLEQASWKCGRDFAMARWKRSARDHSPLLIQDALAAFRDSPMCPPPPARAFLEKRSTRTRSEIELMGCPHMSRFSETRAVAGHLCPLHAGWTRGFAYGLDTRIAVEYSPGTDGSRCVLQWHVSQ